MKRLLSRAARFVVDTNLDRKFEHIPGAYRGVFRSSEEARASTPNMKVGFDHPELTNIYDARKERVFPSDYPILFWLRELLGAHRSVFDFGGHVGVSFYAYRKYLQFSPAVRWRVCDVPEIAKAGRELAATTGETRLSFCTEFAEAEGFDILLASGSLQFLEEPLPSMLRRLKKRPKHVLVNKLPLYDGEPFVTLQNTIYSVNPYFVGNRRAFEEGIRALGYELVDTWENADLSCKIPRHRDHSIDSYAGLYFKATDA